MFVSSRFGQGLVAVAVLAIALPMTINQLNAKDNYKSTPPANEMGLWYGLSMGAGIAVESASECQTFKPNSDSHATYSLRCQATEIRASEVNKKNYIGNRQLNELRKSR